MMSPPFSRSQTLTRTAVFHRFSNMRRDVAPSGKNAPILSHSQWAAHPIKMLDWIPGPSVAKAAACAGYG
jgi:hypothetical protein